MNDSCVNNRLLNRFSDSGWDALILWRANLAPFAVPETSRTVGSSGENEGRQTFVLHSRNIWKNQIFKKPSRSFILENWLLHSCGVRPAASSGRGWGTRSGSMSRKKKRVGGEKSESDVRRRQSVCGSIVVPMKSHETTLVSEESPQKARHADTMAIDGIYSTLVLNWKINLVDNPLSVYHDEDASPEYSWNLLYVFFV